MNYSNQFITEQLIALASRIGFDISSLNFDDFFNHFRQKCCRNFPFYENALELLVTSNQLGLNPFNFEIYGMQSKSKEVFEVCLTLDGWMALLNRHPMFDSLEAEPINVGTDELEACVVRMYRKDRSRPTVITEFLRDCNLNTSTWKQFPTRMLRHKTVIQCARVAFGFAELGVNEQFDVEVADDSLDYNRPVSPIRMVANHEAALATQNSQVQAVVEQTLQTQDDVYQQVKQSLFPQMLSEANKGLDALQTLFDKIKESDAQVKTQDPIIRPTSLAFGMRMVLS